MASDTGARQVRVTRGFSLLGQDKPRWPWAINPDKLLVGDHRWGVLGQVYAEQAGPRADPHNLGLRLLGLHPGEAADYGFEALSEQDRDALGLIWAGHVLTLRVGARIRPPATSGRDLQS
jgi:hypothetical protein